MIHWNALRLMILILVGLAVGCGKDERDNDKPAVEDHSGHDHGDEMKHESGGEDAFAGLSAADAKLARAQDVCPVGDDKLGSMGTPIKVMVGDRPVFLCCKNCRGTLLKNPDKYIAKLGK